MRKEDYQRTCPECETGFEASRLDQKFCCRKCQNHYNNRKARNKRLEAKKVVLPIEAILRKNREILKAHHDIGQVFQLSQTELEAAGFDFRFYTHTEDNTESQLHFQHVHDYAVVRQLDGNYKIIHHVPAI